MIGTPSAPCFERNCSSHCEPARGSIASATSIGQRGAISALRLIDRGAAYYRADDLDILDFLFVYGEEVL